MPAVKIVVIGNPIAGGGAAGPRIEKLADLLRHRGHTVEVFLTRKAGEAAQRVRWVEDEAERLVVVGGDGSLNEVLNGLEDPTRVPIAQLPTGTANILARELGFPFHPEGTATLIEAGQVRRIDMGLVGDKRFLMVVSCGFDALVTRELKAKRRGTLGYVGYLPPILRAVGRYVPPRLRVAIDSRPEVECELVIASNTKNYAGLFTVADRACCDSGHLDVCMLSRASVPRLLKHGLEALVGGLSGKGGVTYVTGTRVAIGSQAPAPVEVDGDYFGSTPIVVELRPRSVPVLVPG